MCDSHFPLALCLSISPRALHSFIAGGPLSLPPQCLSVSNGLSGGRSAFRDLSDIWDSMDCPLLLAPFRLPVHFSALFRCRSLDTKLLVTLIYPARCSPNGLGGSENIKCWLIFSLILLMLYVYSLHPPVPPSVLPSPPFRTHLESLHQQLLKESLFQRWRQADASFKSISKRHDGSLNFYAARCSRHTASVCVLLLCMRRSECALI